MQARRPRDDYPSARHRPLPSMLQHVSRSEEENPEADLAGYDGETVAASS